LSSALVQRQIALAAVALLAVVVALAVTQSERDPDETRQPQVAATPWYSALAAPYRFPPGTRRTACGYPTNASTLGVAHPVLPCGAKITILFDGRQVLTQVVDKGTGVPGREFDVTAPLARRMGLRGIKPIKWRFAQAS
jgi:hypothetical protein